MFSRFISPEQLKGCHSGVLGRFLKSGCTSKLELATTRFGMAQRRIMKSPLLAALALFCSVLCSCVSVQDASPAQRQMAVGQPSAGKAKIFVYRPSRFLAAALVHNVFVDGRLLGTNASGYFLVAELEPGNHIVTAGTDQHGLIAKPGHIYYFDQTVRLAAYDPSTATGLEEVSESVGRAGVAECKQAAANF